MLAAAAKGEGAAKTGAEEAAAPGRRVFKTREAAARATSATPGRGPRGKGTAYPTPTPGKAN